MAPSGTAFMNQSRLQELGEVTNLDELLKAFVHAGHDLGYGMFSLAYIQPDAGDGMFGQSISELPEAWLQHAKDPEAARIDPVFNRLTVTREPFFYDQDFYVAAGQGTMWEQGAQFGIAAGVCATLHLHGGRRILWGFDGHKIPKNDYERTHLLATTQLLGVFAASSVERLLSTPRKHVLSESQLAVLKYTREGYPAWKIAHFMGITEDTVNYHLKQCRAKLGVANKHHAVQKAIQVGLLV